MKPHQETKGCRCKACFNLKAELELLSKASRTKYLANINHYYESHRRPAQR